MDLISAIILGIVQGLTEFLPVSSSGHLVIFRYILNVEGADLSYDILLHIATLIPIFIIFWKDIREIVIEVSELIKDIIRKAVDRSFVFKMNENRIFIIMIIVASIPTALMGLLLRGITDTLFQTLNVVGFSYIYTGVLLMLADRIRIGKKEIKDISSKNAFIVGVFQGISLLPGISRSGSTIVGGLLNGFTRKTAVRFSFIITIPAIIGATLLDFKNLIDMGINPDMNIPMIFGFIVAALSGYVAIKVLIKLLSRGRIHVFAYYCWALALLVLLYNFIIG